jgi:N-acetyl-anhydromuramyl-L-alanine amidase AmpD
VPTRARLDSRQEGARAGSAVARFVLVLLLVLVLTFGGAGCSSPGRSLDDERRLGRAPAPSAGAGTADPAASAEPGAAGESGASGASAPDAAAAPDAPPAPGITIKDAPMPWGEERAALTLEYRRLHSDRAAKDLDITPRVIVLHYTGAGTASSARSTFAPARLGTSRPELQRGGAVNVSAHFLVDRDGTILRLQPETRYARHCIGLNHISIGIENVGDEAKWPLTEAQVAANVALVRDLARRFPITHLLGHHEAASFAGHAYFVELVRSYTNTKPDPGARFMKRVREAVADLSLAGL